MIIIKWILTVINIVITNVVEKCYKIVFIYFKDLVLYKNKNTVFLNWTAYSRVTARFNVMDADWLPVNTRSQIYEKVWTQQCFKLKLLNKTTVKFC